MFHGPVSKSALSKFLGTPQRYSFILCNREDWEQPSLFTLFPTASRRFSATSTDKIVAKNTWSRKKQFASFAKLMSIPASITQANIDKA